MMRTCIGTLVSGALCTISRNAAEWNGLPCGFCASLLYRRLSAGWYGCTCLLNRYGAQAPDMMRTCIGTLVSGDSCTISRNLAVRKGFAERFLCAAALSVSLRELVRMHLIPACSVWCELRSIDLEQELCQVRYTRYQVHPYHVSWLIGVPGVL